MFVVRFKSKLQKLCLLKFNLLYKSYILKLEKRFKIIYKNVLKTNKQSYYNLNSTKLIRTTKVTKKLL